MPRCPTAGASFARRTRRCSPARARASRRSPPRRVAARRASMCQGIRIGRARRSSYSLRRIGAGRGSYRDPARAGQQARARPGAAPRAARPHGRDAVRARLHRRSRPRVGALHSRERDQRTAPARDRAVDGATLRGTQAATAEHPACLGGGAWRGAESADRTRRRMPRFRPVRSHTIAPPFVLAADVCRLEDAYAAADAGATEIALDPFLRHPLPPVSRVAALASAMARVDITFPPAHTGDRSP